MNRLVPALQSLWHGLPQAIACYAESVYGFAPMEVQHDDR